MKSARCPAAPLLLLPLCLCAMSEMPAFLMDYHAYLVGFSSDFTQYGFDDRGKIMRWPREALEMRMKLNAALKMKLRWAHFCLKSDLRSRLFKQEENKDWDMGAGDVEIYACRPLNSRLLLGIKALLPTASYRHNLGLGCQQYEAFLALRYGLSMTGEGLIRYYTENPDRVRPGPQIIGSIGWEELFTANLFFSWQMPDRLPGGAGKDKASYTLRVRLGILDDQFGDAMSFINIYSDVLGRDAPLLSGISIGAAL